MHVLQVCCSTAAGSCSRRQAAGAVQPTGAYRGVDSYQTVQHTDSCQQLFIRIKGEVKVVTISVVSG
jgi:hypothetical protein